MKIIDILNRKSVFIILLLIKIASGNSNILPVCKTCIITAEENSELKFNLGWENEQSCIIDNELCKDFIDKKFCIGFTIEFKYMGTYYGKEYNKTCIVDPIIDKYPICKGCSVILEERKYSWSFEDDKMCLLDLYKCKPNIGSDKRSYPYYIFVKYY
ncbi:hypothetical protein BCR36DRAFT_318165 [Piromyces finnis]|uniref:Apple domain-containing protein n=1 Tax=Piromyces finnis TaxID=1754191 RepID=A0A1Y1VKI2_9FUNG|nr:hypothetical protein BCR36DRAFT_318165 [Piromyces finnis]|eukprot:ORX58592.1 hypothetical protein BCR36DRAFT_318165 [Piromyces finnis]